MDTAFSDSSLHELVLDRRLDAPRAAVWRCWTEPALIVRWFTPAPWTTTDAEIDLRPGGVFATTMRSPEGETFPNVGVILEAAPGERLVFTDAYSPGWIPAEKPFFTGIVSLADEGGGTRYVAQARHWTAEDRAKHESIGFQDGWGAAANQLERLAASL